MGHSTIKLIPGVDVTATPVLNQAGISTSNLMRFFYDRGVGALSQKLGGWTRFVPQTTPAITRALWPWEDTNGVQHLAYGTENTLAGRTTLAVITNGSTQDITPRATTNPSATVTVATTAGSSLVIITDATVTGITDYDSVYIAVPISVGGLVLFGQYQCDPNGFIAPSSYTVQAIDVLGNPVLATSTSTTGVVPDITVISGNPVVTVTFPNHGKTVGSTFTVLVSTTVGGTTFYGDFLVTGVTDANNFTINAPTTPSASTSGFINGGKAYYIYSFGVGSIPAGTGYGVGPYGSGGYGSGTAVTPGTGTAISANDWVLDNWGEILLACPENPTAVPYQPIYQWDPISGSPTASVIPQAPPVNDGFFVAMPQRQIIAWGSTFDGIQDPLLVRWCDVSNFSIWAGQVTNQAGSYRIPRGSKIVGGIQGPQQGLLWTDLGVWAMQYQSLPYVYGFSELGSGCGMIARKAAGTLGGIVYWMGPSQFFALSGEGVQPIPCPVWDVVFQDIDQSNLQKIRVAVNSRFGEIAWYYPSLQGSGEVDSYVKFNPSLNAWDYGSLARSAWTDQSVLGPPIGADPNLLYLYQHETSPDADGQPLLASLQTGYFAIGDGEDMTFVNQFWPDLKWGYFNGDQNATVNITFYVADYPGQTPKVIGPYSVTQQTTYISPRFRGRLVSIAISSNDVGTFWRLGGSRYQWSPDGKY
jgi:hypothetical protein